MKFSLLRIYILVALPLSIILNSHAQTTIFLFSFENTDVVTINNAVETPVFSVIGELTGPNYYTGASGSAISYAGWNTGDALRFTVNTTNYTSLTFDYHIRCSNTMVGYFQLEASTDEENWIILQEEFRPTTTFENYLFEMPSEFDNQPTVYIQIIKTNEPGSSGNNIRIDEVLLSGYVDVGVGPSITHLPLADTNSPKDRVVTATITGNDLIIDGEDRPVIWHRFNDGEFEYSYYDERDEDDFYFTIPGRIDRGKVDYYIAAKDSDDVSTRPHGGSENPPPGIAPPDDFYSYNLYVFIQSPNIVHDAIGHTDSMSDRMVTAQITGNNLITQGDDRPILWYRVDGGVFVPVYSHTQAADEFTFAIPGQTDNVTIDYYIAAKDQEQVTTIPAGGGGVDPPGTIPPLTFYSYHSYNFAEPPSYNLYYGSIHAHTWYSDGNKDQNPAEYTQPVARAITYGRDVAVNMDFLAITDHNHMLTMDQWRASHQEADSLSEDGVFVGFIGTEWGTGAHVLTFTEDRLLGWIEGRYDVYVEQNNYRHLWHIADSLNGFCYLAHPGMREFNDLLGTPYNPDWDRVIQGTAIRNGPAMSTNTTQTDPATGDYEPYYHGLLKLGYRVAPSADQDNHYTTFGMVNQQRTVVLAPSFTRTNIMNALRHRRAYATDDHNIQVRFEIGPMVMGDEFKSESPFTIRLKVSDPDPDDTISRMEIRYGIPGSGADPQVLVSENSMFAEDSLIYTVDQEPGTTYYYYAFIQQTDGHKVWTAPIWITAESTTDVSSNRSVQYDYNLYQNYPNPFNPSTTIKFTVRQNVHGNISVYNTLGQKVAVLFDGRLETGTHEITFDASNLPSGVYFYRLQAGEYVESRKMLYLK